MADRSCSNCGHLSSVHYRGRDGVLSLAACTWCQCQSFARVDPPLQFVACPSCSKLRTENAELRAALDLELSRRTLGGTPPPPDENWANKALPPPESATTGPTAPKGMARSDDHLRERQ